MDKRFPDCALTITQELEMCRLYIEEGVRTAELGRRFGIRGTSAARILHHYKVPLTKKLYSYDESFFDSIDTEAKAYFLGLITADGYVVNNARRYVVQLTLCDKEAVEAFRTAISGNQPIYEVDMSKWRGRTAYMLAVGSKRMVESLAKFGVVQRKSEIAAFTNLVPDELIHHYMRGIFDGDGSVGNYEYQPGHFRTIFSLSGSEAVVRGYTERLRQMTGVRIPAVSYATGRYKCIYSHRKDLASIASFLYRDCTLSLQRKHEKLLPFIRSGSV